MFAVRSPLPQRVSRVRSNPRKSIKPVRSIIHRNSRHLYQVSETDAFYILTLYADGIYSVQSYDDDELPVNNVVAFLTYDDAHRYKMFLESISSMVTRVECVPRIVIENTSYNCLVINKDVVIFPPCDTVEVTDWEKRNALINGRWSVREKSQ
jgi:hypothetical protein